MNFSEEARNPPAPPPSGVGWGWGGVVSALATPTYLPGQGRRQQPYTPTYLPQTPRCYPTLPPS
jgi:hypothetical protein